MSPVHTSSSTGITFSVDDVEPCSKAGYEVPMHQALQSVLGEPVESCSSYHDRVLAAANFQALLAAVYIAYCEHRPLVLSPDVVWLTIEQGIAHHMAVRGEQLRQRFVSHQGRLDLGVRRDEFVLASPENDWQGCFEEWCDQIRQHVGEELHACLKCDFSTTGPVERAASHVIMMDVFQRYFRFVIYYICGIPSIHLRGTPEDWKRLRSKVDALQKFDIEWWLQELRPICDQFVRASEGDIDLQHWQSICKIREQYGGAEINGWIARMFPYVRVQIDGPCTRRNPVFQGKHSITTLMAPSGLSRVPIVAENPVTGERHRKEVIGGLVGVRQHSENLALEPLAGWAVRQADGLDAMLAQLASEHETTRKDHQFVSAEDHEKNSRLSGQNLLPSDISQFYFEFTQATIRYNGQKAVRIVSEDRVVDLNWGEESSGSIVASLDSTWRVFAWTSDGRQIAIYLDQDRFDRASEQGLSIGKENYAPICVTSEHTHKKRGRNPVVALSFTEFLTRTLAWAAKPHSTDRVQYYWESPDFPSLGDAFDYM